MEEQLWRKFCCITLSDARNISWWGFNPNHDGLFCCLKLNWNMSLGHMTRVWEGGWCTAKWVMIKTSAWLINKYYNNYTLTTKNYIKMCFEYVPAVLVWSAPPRLAIFSELGDKRGISLFCSLSLSAFYPLRVPEGGANENVEVQSALQQHQSRKSLE